MRASAPAEHSTSDDHIRANNLELAKAQMKKVTNNAINKAHEHTCSLMKIVFWLAKNDIPLHKFPSVIQLGRALESPKIISSTNSITYENPVSGREFLSAVALSIEEKIWEELKNTSFIGIMIDESTDIACESHMIIYGTLNIVSKG